MSTPVVCDRCGRPLPGLADARVYLVNDESGRCVGMGVCHRSCVDALRHELEKGSARDREAVVIDQPGEAFLDVGRVRSLRATARTHSASASRVLGKLKRLWVGQLAGTPVRRTEAPL